MTTLQALRWLLRHEIRLILRASPAWKWLLPIMALVSLGLVVLAWQTKNTWFSRLPDLPSDVPSGVLLIFTGTLFFLLTIMLSGAVQNTIQTLFDRGDLDLILSSPLDSRVVLAARGLWIVFSSFVSVAIFILPLAITATAFIGIRALGAVVLLVALAFFAGGAGLMLTLLLVRIFGARRAKTIAQVLGALLGASVYLLSQSARFISKDSLPWLQNIASALTSLPSSHPLFFPAKAVLFDPLPTVTMLTVGIAFFAVGVQITHRVFVIGATSSLVGGKVRVSSLKNQRFEGNFLRNLIKKEWRLILRDPMLISQTLMQLLYLIPLFFVFLGGSSRTTNVFGAVGIFPILATAAIMIGGTLAQNLAQIIVASEEAPELLRMSPVSPAQLRLGKLVAANAPVWAIFIPIIVWRSSLEPISWLVLPAFATITILGSLMTLWTAKPFIRSDLIKQRRGQNFWVGIAMLVMYGTILGALLLHNWWSIPLIAVTAFVPWLTWILNKEFSRLGY